MIRVRLELESDIGQTYVNCACAMSTLRSAFCKLHRLTNRAQQLFIYLLLKSYPKYKIDRDRNIAHDTDKNIKT